MLLTQDVIAFYKTQQFFPDLVIEKFKVDGQEKWPKCSRSFENGISNLKLFWLIFSYYICITWAKLN